MKNKNVVLLAASALLVSNVTLSDPVISGEYDLIVDHGINGVVADDIWAERYQCSGYTSISTNGDTENNFSCYRTLINGFPDPGHNPSTIEGTAVYNSAMKRTAEVISIKLHTEPTYHRAHSGSRPKNSNDPFTGVWHSNSGTEGDFTFHTVTQ